MMAARGLSSGDLIVDRRFDFAEGLALGGDLPAAIEVLGEAMERVPGWAAGWFRLGEWHEAAGAPERAAEAWDRALAADPQDLLGAGLKRDLVRAAPVAETMPAAFVEALFDDYAPRFDRALVERLDYCAPELLRRGLDGRRFGRAMDLGCGTGLAGAAFRDICERLEGIDISAGMLAQAEAKGLYDRLAKGDLAALEIGPERYDLIIAADVFVYLGALERILGWCAGSLAPGGVLAFTVEAAAPGEGPLALRESRRFAHAPDHLRAVLAAAGFGSVRLDRAALRSDRGAVIEGFVVIATDLARTPDRQGDGEDVALA
ncbi:methyltransferase domain-containing protein [Rhodovulum sp. YEN HP10]|uniref:methyltransferase domain-containing protein n=1 Tax=Rhodovulum sp. HP10 TaxID=3387397 RepID=UPI0039E05BC1